MEHKFVIFSKKLLGVYSIGKKKAEKLRDNYTEIPTELVFSKNYCGVWVATNTPEDVLDALDEIWYDAAAKQ
jgi:hypothetical protein